MSNVLGGSEPTPTFCGVPLPIAPDIENWPPRPQDLSKHHSWHPSADPLLANIDDIANPELEQRGGWALRNSAMQMTDKSQHNNGPDSYHAIWGGSPVPRDPGTQFRCVVLQLAGLVPPEGLDPSSGEPVIVQLTGLQRGILQTPLRNAPVGYEYYRHGYQQTRQFIEAFVLSRPLYHVKPAAIQEFVDGGTDEERYKRLGHMLLMQLVVVAAHNTDLHATYETLKRQGLLDPRVDHAYPTVEDFIKRWLLRTRVRQESHLMPLLQSNLLRSA